MTFDKTLGRLFGSSKEFSKAVAGQDFIEPASRQSGLGQKERR
jgi:hypothetical protein